MIDTLSFIEVFERLSTQPLFLCSPVEGFRFVYANPAAIQHLGYSRDQLAALRYPATASFPLLHIQQQWDKLTVDDNIQVATHILPKEGEPIAVEMFLHRLPHEGQLLLLGHFRVLRSQDTMERQLAEAQAATRQALTVRDRFLTHMSHELRTPLNGIIGLSHLARDTESLTLARDYFRQINQSGEYLLSTVSDILDFCQVESGIVTLNPVSFNPAILIREVFQRVKPLAMAKGLKLNSDIEPTLPGYLMGDAQRLRQVLLKLVENAVKFTLLGEVCIRVQRGLTLDDHRILVQIAVSDTGAGIRPEDRPRLFRAFEQLDPSDCRHHQGSGLGLALAWHLVKLMGGSQIHLDSTPGQGSTFSFELPFDPASVSQMKQYDIQVLDEKPLRGLNILIVEDNYINCTILRAMVEKAGATTAVAENGAVAVDKLRNSAHDTYDVILMDIQMPIMDGYTATRLIREDLKLHRIPVIATTAHTLSSDRQACLDAGMNAHIGKPIDRQLLIPVILQYLPGKDDFPLDIVPSMDDHPLQLAALVNMNRIFKASIPNVRATLLCIGNDEHLYCELIRLFVLQHTGDMQHLDECLQQADHAQARTISHTLKELTHTLGLMPLHEAMARLYFRLQTHPGERPGAELKLAAIEMQTTIRTLRQLLLGLPL